MLITPIFDVYVLIISERHHTTDGMQVGTEWRVRLEVKVRQARLAVAQKEVGGGVIRVQHRRDPTLVRLNQATLHVLPRLAHYHRCHTIPTTVRRPYNIKYV